MSPTVVFSTVSILRTAEDEGEKEVIGVTTFAQNCLCAATDFKEIKYLLEFGSSS